MKKNVTYKWKIKFKSKDNLDFDWVKEEFDSDDDKSISPTDEEMDSYSVASSLYSGANNMMGGRADMQDLEFERMNEDGFPIMKSKNGAYSIQFVLIDLSKGKNKE